MTGVLTVSLLYDRFLIIDVAFKTMGFFKGSPAQWSLHIKTHRSYVTSLPANFTENNDGEAASPTCFNGTFSGLKTHTKNPTESVWISTGR